MLFRVKITCKMKTFTVYILFAGSVPPVLFLTVCENINYITRSNLYPCKYIVPSGTQGCFSSPFINNSISISISQSLETETFQHDIQGFKTSQPFLIFPLKKQRLGGLRQKVEGKRNADPEMNLAYDDYLKGRLVMRSMLPYLPIYHFIQVVQTQYRQPFIIFKAISNLLFVVQATDDERILLLIQSLKNKELIHLYFSYEQPNYR